MVIDSASEVRIEGWSYNGEEAQMMHTTPEDMGGHKHTEVPYGKKRAILVKQYPSQCPPFNGFTHNI
jgi:hypothetical protein